MVPSVTGMTASQATAAPYPLAAQPHRPGAGLLMDCAAHASEADVAALRHQAADTARRAYLGAVDALADDVALVTSELVANAVRHGGGGAIEVLQALVAGGVVLCVFDASSAPPVLRELGPDREDGRGLHVVDALSAGRWGHFPIPGGKYVWAQLSLPAPQTAATPTDSPLEGS